MSTIRTVFNLSASVSGGWAGTTSVALTPPNDATSTFASGTGAGQYSKSYATTLTLSATPTTLDLTALTDPLLGAVAFSRVIEVYIRNNATTDGWGLAVLPGASNGWVGTAQFFQGTAGVIVGPSTSSTSPCTGLLHFAAPNTTGYVVDSTHKTLKLDPGVNNFTADILILGN